jgi:hypothetical protein
MNDILTRTNCHAACAIALAVVLSAAARADHKPDHVSEGVGQIDTSQYHCEDADGNLLGATECMLMKLDRIERKLGCPLDAYLDGSCPYSPADTTATFCISQGREGGIAAGWGIVPYMEGELGAGWPNVGWGKLTGKVENPLFVPLGPILLPIPTELSVGGSAALGRNFDICIEVPLEAADHLAAGERVSDAEIIDRVVRHINEPYLDTGPSKSKFQRRLGRLANYAIFRVPGTNRFELAHTGAAESGLAQIMDDDGESEFDVIEDAMERILSGDWQVPADGGPLAVLKSPAVDEIRTVLEVPEPVQAIIDDPDQILGAVFALGSGSLLAAAQPGSAIALAPGAACDAFGLNTTLRNRFPAVDQFCGLFGQLPSFQKTIGVFGVIDTIKLVVDGLPTLAEIKQASCDIAGWLCPE